MSNRTQIPNALIYDDLPDDEPDNITPAVKLSDKLPPLTWGNEIQDAKITLPDELIVGMLHVGSKMVLGGGSKSFKTYCLADLAISIAAGIPWWGREVKQGRVVYLNLEVQEEFFNKRLQDIAKAKGCAVPADLAVWPLRGYCADHSELFPLLEERLKGMSCAALVLDPVYKIMAGSENAQEQVAAMMNGIERLGKATGAAIIFGAHFAKGSAATKEAIDRISGSGVFARDPDAILTMTKHEEDDCFVIDPILRNCPPVEPFVVRWEWPLMTAADGMDAKALKQPATGKKVYTAEDAINAMPVGKPISKPEFVKAGQSEGIGKSRMYELISSIQDSKHQKVRISCGLFTRLS